MVGLKRYSIEMNIILQPNNIKPIQINSNVIKDLISGGHFSPQVTLINISIAPGRPYLSSIKDMGQSP
tara:strand:- start:583 stop:786 length:204 start_codon:yes stop_codon:yes gene_type:complete